MCIKSYSQNEESITTIIVLRHAEKSDEPGNNDPGLSTEGLKRANNIAELFQNEEISAVYATPYQRTRLTLTPLAEAKGLKIEEYSPVDKSGFKQMLHDNMGKTIVISGHSNTVPIIVQYFDPSENKITLNEDDYNKIFVVSKSSTGSSATLKMVLK